MVHIEFMGIPGAGKSTLHRQLFSDPRVGERRIYSAEEILLDALKHRTDDPVAKQMFRFLPERILRPRAYGVFRTSWSLLASQGRFMAEHPDLVSFLTSDAYRRLKSITPEERAVGLSAALETASRYQMISETSPRDRIVVFPEGFYHKIMSLFVSPGATDAEVRRDTIRHYLQSIPTADVVVWVEVDISECIRRMFGRTKGRPGRLKHLDENQVASFLQICQDLFRWVAAEAAENGKTLVHVVNDGPLEQSLGRLKQGLAESLSGKPNPA